MKTLLSGIIQKDIYRWTEDFPYISKQWICLQDKSWLRITNEKHISFLILLINPLILQRNHLCLHQHPIYRNISKYQIINHLFFFLSLLYAIHLFVCFVQPAAQFTKNQRKKSSHLRSWNPQMFSLWWAIN